MVNPDGNYTLRDDGADGALQNANGEHADESPDGDKQESVPLVNFKGPNQLEEGANSAGNQSTVKKSHTNFDGLTKEELEKFVKDPFWRRLRMIFFILFWVVWVGMLAAVIIIIVVSPKCPPRPTRQFWQKPFYRLQVKSFAPAPDAGPASVGSIDGLVHKLDYLRTTLGVDNFLIDSLVSGDSSFGCIKDFKAINPTLGSVDTLKAFTKQGRKKGFNLMMEFDASQSDIDWGKKEFFISSPTKLPKLASRDGGAAWHSDRLNLPRNKCPSLNISSPVVQEKLEEALAFWLDAGLSGFVLTNVAFMSPAEPNASIAATDNWFEANPTPALFSPASVEFVRSVRRFLNAQAEKRGRELALFVDPGNTGFPQPEEKLASYLDPTSPGMAHAVISTGLGVPLNHQTPAEPRSSQQVIEDTLKAIKNSGSVAFATAWPRLRRPQESYLTVLSLTLPGVPCIYYGQELGMAHVPGFHFSGPGLTSYLNGNDSTDLSESPMQWSNSINAGWLANETTPLTWVNLTIRAADIETHNLRRLSSAGHPFSQLQLVKSLIELVNTKESFQWGELTFLTEPSAVSASPSDLIVFKRQAERFPPVVVVVNPSDKPTTLDLSNAGSAKGTLKVMHSSVADATSSYELDKDYDLKRVYAPAKSILVFIGKD